MIDAVEGVPGLSCAFEDLAATIWAGANGLLCQFFDRIAPCREHRDGLGLIVCAVAR